MLLAVMLAATEIIITLPLSPRAVAVVLVLLAEPSLVRQAVLVVLVMTYQHLLEEVLFLKEQVAVAEVTQVVLVVHLSVVLVAPIMPMAQQHLQTQQVVVEDVVVVLHRLET